MKAGDSIKKKRNGCNGFSLLEMLIAILISSIIVLAVASFSLSAVKTHRLAVDLQNDLEDARGAMEIMAKDIRMSSDLRTYNPSENDIRIKMNNSSKQKCVAYWFDNNARLLRSRSFGYVSEISPRCGEANNNWGNISEYSLVGDANFTGNFHVFETDMTSSTHVMGRVVIQIGVGESEVHYLQTTVSLRDYEALGL